MSQLRLIYQLLCEEYAASRHIFWLDENASKWVNDVTYTLHLIVKAAQGLRRGEQDGWCELATYAIERSMSYLLIHATGEYLAKCADLSPLPVIDLTEGPYRNWRGTVVPLFDESDHPHLHCPTYQPEPDRRVSLKCSQVWSYYPMRMRDEHPHPTLQIVSKSVHWLF